MDIQEYFNKKKSLTDAQAALDTTVQTLVNGFEDNYYFKMNKRATIIVDTLNCNFTISFFIPQLKGTTQKAIELLFLANFNFNKKHALQLTGAKGFTVTAKERELSQDRMLLMMYPEIKVSDLESYEDTTYAIFKGLVKMQRKSVLSQDFDSFCSEMTSFIAPAIKEINAHNKNHVIDYLLTDKEHEFIIKKFNLTFKIVMKSIKTRNNTLKLEAFDELLLALSDIEKKKLHHELDSGLSLKPKSPFNKKI